MPSVAKLRAILAIVCDEFPFAATYQSGAMFGLSGAGCSQAEFSFNSTTSTWTDSPLPGYSPTQRCGLGHVPLSDNKSVGGQYSTFIQNNRVLDKDKFWIKVL